MVLRAEERRTGDIIAAYHGTRFVDLTEKNRAVPIKVMTGSLLRPVFIDDPVASPHYFVVSEPGNNILPPLPFPTFNVFGRDIGNHVHATAGTASTTGKVSILFQRSPSCAASYTFTIVPLEMVSATISPF